MVVRGRLAFDDQGRLVEIAEDAADPNNPQPSEIDPVEFEELIAQTAAAQNLDAGQLLSSLDAAGYDISNVEALDSQSLTTDVLNITEEINYWPPKRISKTTELDTTSPATSYTTVTLSALPSDATVALIGVGAKGSGTAGAQKIALRENGTSRDPDAKVVGWAGHGAFDINNGPLFIPVDSNNRIEYDTNGTTARIVIDSLGYY